MANVTKKEVYDIINGDDVSPLIANQPHFDLEENVDRILAFLNGGSLNADSVGGISPANLARQDFLTDNDPVRPTGWYRIAHNGPVMDGGTGGDRAHATFTVLDTHSGRHSSTTFIASYHFGAEPTLTLLSKSAYGNTGGLITAVRMVSGGLEEGAAIEVYVTGGGPVEVHMYDNTQSTGWTLDAFVSGFLPTGHSATQLNFQSKNMVFGTASSGVDNFYINREGKAYSNGQVFYTADNSGPGSGMDADLLDGYHGSSFARKSENLAGLTNPQTALANLGISNFFRLSVTLSTTLAEAQSGYRLNADGFHTHGLGFGEIFIEGSRIDANSAIYIGTGRAAAQTPRIVYLNNPHNQNGQPLLDESSISNYMAKADNLNGLVNVAASRINLGLNNHEKISVNSAGIATAVDFTATSDRRLKSNITVYEDVLATFHCLRAVKYDMDKVTSVGVIAQEVEAFIPEVVHTDADGMKSVNYGKLSVLSINAINELSDRMSDVEEKLNKLLDGLL